MKLGSIFGYLLKGVDVTTFCSLFHDQFQAVHTALAEWAELTATLSFERKPNIEICTLQENSRKAPYWNDRDWVYNRSRVVKSPIKLTQDKWEFLFDVTVRWGYLYIVSPSVLSFNNPKLHEMKAVKNICLQDKMILWLTLNHGLVLTGFLTEPDPASFWGHP